MALSACGRGAARVAQRVEAWPITTVALELAAGGALELQTRNARRGVRPVLHLWDVERGRELAHAKGSMFFRHDARLFYRNDSGRVRRLQLLIRAAGARHGVVDVYRDGKLLIRAARAGGTLLPLRVAPGLVFQAAAAPAGLRSARLLLIGKRGELLAQDAASGPTGLPRLSFVPHAHALIVASAEAAPGRVSVYANDGQDRDGDGLGRALERALGTCDDPNDPPCRRGLLRDYYVRVPHATRDSDRDGISDGDELFGVHAPLLDLPRFGADPRHKDVFVEVDHHAQLETVGFSEQDFADIARLFAAGSARALRNPDGLPGVHLHFDAGFWPEQPEHAELLGDFGGSGTARAGEYRSARRQDFSPARSGYFRYAFSTRSGRGQTSGDAFTVNRDLARVTIFAHELGHALGLAHYGHADWGRENCKPNYFSIMNYLYQNRYEVGFSRSSTRPLDPAGLFERAAVSGRASAAFLRDAPLELDVHGRDIDWNRDGVISDQAVRADLLWATYKTCGAAEHGLVQLADSGIADATPVLLRAHGRLQALWVRQDGRLGWREASAAPDASWSAEQVVTGVSRLRQIAGLALPDGDVLLASVLRDGALHLSRLRFEQGALVCASDRELPGVRSVDPPSLARVSVDERYYGVGQVLAVAVRAAADGGLYQVSLRDPESGFVVRRMFDARGQPLTAALAPSLLRLPSGELLAVLPDPEGLVRVFAYDAGLDGFRDLSPSAFSTAIGPRSSGPVSVALHRYRSADGSQLSSGTRAALYLSFTEPESSAARFPDDPHLLVSEWLAVRAPLAEQLALRWRGALIGEWTTLAAGSGVALYEDEQSQHLTALMARFDGRAQRVLLEFLPYADGEFSAQLAGGNDFEVMERAICTGIRSEAQCGDRSTGAY